MPCIRDDLLLASYQESKQLALALAAFVGGYAEHYRRAAATLRDYEWLW